jgi:hypothetical protein
VTAAVIVDAAGAQMVGAARYLDELREYLRRTGRQDVKVIGSRHRSDVLIAPSTTVLATMHATLQAAEQADDRE